MVKGTTQQVIVVRAPESALFDEASFLIRPGAAEQQAVTDRMLLEEARRAAAAAVPERAAFWRQRLAGALCGAGATGLVWLLTALL